MKRIGQAIQKFILGLDDNLYDYEKIPCKKKMKKHKKSGYKKYVKKKKQERRRWERI